MADLHPNDIGLATFEDVGDVNNLQTKAKEIVEAINEIKEAGGSLSSLEDQLYVDGENNIILGKGNVVYGSNNLVIGSDNVVAANNLIVLGSGKQAYAPPDNFYASYDFNTGGVYCDGGTDTASMFAIGDKAVLEVSASWASEDWSDYRSVDSGKQIVTVSGIDGTTLQFEQFEVDTSPPDAEHPILEYIYINIFVPLNAAFHLDMPENADVLLMVLLRKGPAAARPIMGKQKAPAALPPTPDAPKAAIQPRLALRPPQGYTPLPQTRRGQTPKPPLRLTTVTATRRIQWPSGTPQGRMGAP